LNVLLFNLAFVAGVIVLLKRRKPEYLTAQTWALLAAQVFFSAMFVLRDSEQLLVADSVAIVAAMSVLIVPKLGLAPRVADALHYLAALVWAVLNSMFGGVALLVGDIEWKTADRSAVSRTAVGVIRGLLIVTPFILIFGALFVAADAAYEGLVNRVFNFDISIAVSHIALFSVFAWATAGYLRAIAIGRPPLSTEGGNPSGSEGASLLQEEEIGRKGDEEPCRTGGNPSTGVPAAASASGVRAGSEGVSSTGGNATVRERAASPVSFIHDSDAERSGLPDNATILEHINRSDPPQAPAPLLPEEGWHPDVVHRDDGVAGAAEPRPKWSWATLDNSLLPSAFTLGAVEVGIIFGLIDLLFVSFVVVQLPYLFGGMELVQNTPDFSLAEYARRGFGELVAVAALVLPLLLIAHWLIRSETARAERLFRVLAGVQILLLFVIMASAVQRLLILTGPVGYGLTTVRFYPMVFMTWLAVVFLWFAFTVLRGDRKLFAWGALWSAFFILGATNFLNPDEFIVRTNMKLMQQGRDFDAKYNARLSDDSVPALTDAWPLLNSEQKCEAGIWLRRKLDDGNRSDLRSWNVSRAHAVNLLEGQAVWSDLESCR
jgi:hypothetical protein